MKRIVTIMLALVLTLSAAVALPTMRAQASCCNSIPTFSIVSVVPDKSVTIQTYNFPANDSFDVLMGPIGTKGIHGIKSSNHRVGEGWVFPGNVHDPGRPQRVLPDRHPPAEPLLGVFCLQLVR